MMSDLEMKSKLSDQVVSAIRRVVESSDYLDSTPQLFWDAVDELEAVLPAGQMDERSQQWFLHMLSMQLIREVQTYDRRGTDRVGERPDGVKAIVHRIYSELRNPFLAQAHVRPKLSVSQMRKDKVPDKTIAYEWGLVDEWGEPDYWRLEQEANEPGSVIGNDYCHPAKIKFEQERSAHWKEYGIIAGKFAGTHDPVMESRGDRPRVPCPETAEELFHGGVEAAQAARMLCRDADEIAKIWNRWKANGAPRVEVKPINRDGTEVQDYHGSDQPKDVPEVNPIYQDTQEDAELPTEEEMEEYAGWSRERRRMELLSVSNDDLKALAKGLDISIQGRLSNDKLMKRIVDKEERVVIEEMMAAKG